MKKIKIASLKIGDIIVCKEEGFTTRMEDLKKIRDTIIIYIVNDFHEGGYALLTKLYAALYYDINITDEAKYCTLSIDWEKMLKTEILSNLNSTAPIEIGFDKKQTWYKIEDTDYETREKIWKMIKQIQIKFDFELNKILFN